MKMTMFDIGTSMISSDTEREGGLKRMSCVLMGSHAKLCGGPDVETVRDIWLPGPMALTITSILYLTHSLIELARRVQKPSGQEPDIVELPALRIASGR